MKNEDNSPLRQYVIELTGKGSTGAYSYDISKVNLFPLGQSYLAVADDADKLYTRLDWDFTDFIQGGRIYSYMPVSRDGLKCLQHLSSPLGVTVVDRHGSCPEYGSVEEVAFVQQSIDSMRLTVEDGKAATFPLAGVTALLDDGNISEIIRLKELYITHDTFSVMTDMEASIGIAFGHQWNFRPLGMAIMETLEKVFSKHEDDIMAYIKSKDTVQKDFMHRSSAVYELYRQAKKRSSDGELPLVSQKGYLITFDDDAITLSSICHTPYYHCNTDVLGHLATFVQTSQLEAVTSSDYNIRVVSPETERYDVLSLGLTDSIMNTKGEKGADFSDIIVMKDISGNFSIKASSGGQSLPQKSIENRLGFYYNSLPNASKEKKLFLNALISTVY